MADSNLLVFGATGAIGGALAGRFAEAGQNVFAVSRKGAPFDAPFHSNLEWLAIDVLTDCAFPDSLPKMSAVIWAQGANCNDDIYDLDLERHAQVYDANVTYILISLQRLLKQEKLAPQARLCIISSIWQNIARQRKLTYCISKAALQGMVQSLTIDLGRDGYLVNAVLPGALDTPMTRANLAAEQIGRLEAMTPLGSLPTLDDVFGVVSFLCSDANTGITGQFIAADKGFSHARII